MLVTVCLKPVGLILLCAVFVVIPAFAFVLVDGVESSTRLRKENRKGLDEQLFALSCLFQHPLPLKDFIFLYRIPVCLVGGLRFVSCLLNWGGIQPEQ